MSIVLSPAVERAIDTVVALCSRADAVRIPLQREAHFASNEPMWVFGTNPPFIEDKCLVRKCQANLVAYDSEGRSLGSRSPVTTKRPFKGRDGCVVIPTIAMIECNRTNLLMVYAMVHSRRKCVAKVMEGLD